jgi:hypothetical protein
MYRYVLLFSLVIFFGCKQVYDPDIDANISAIAVQGVLTDIPGQASVSIFKSVPFDSIDNRTGVRGATVIIYDNLGNEYPLEETGYGNYTDPLLVAIEGRSYHLKIITKDGESYESGEQVLPKVFKQDSIYAEDILKKTYIVSSYGEYIDKETRGIETFVDLSSGGTELPKVRYDVRVTVMYIYTINTLTPPVTMFCWMTFNPNTNLNITSSKFDKSIGEITKHSISFFSRNIQEYDNREGVGLVGFWTTVVKYNLNQTAHQYYLDIQNQLGASGKMFDPTPSQIVGNLRCTSNPDKKVFGFFELSKAEKLYYKYRGNNTIIQKDKFPEFSENGESTKAPEFFSY